MQMQTYMNFVKMCSRILHELVVWKQTIPKKNNKHTKIDKRSRRRKQF